MAIKYCFAPNATTGTGLMTNDLSKLKKIKDTIIGLEMQLSLSDRDLSIVSSDLDYLLKKEEDLLFNIWFLKKKKVVVAIAEYFRSTVELEATKGSISRYRNKKSSTVSLVNKLNRSLEIYREDLKAQEKILENRKTILLFDQSKRRKK